MHSSIAELINVVRFLPGIGPRSARRIALYMLRNKERFFSYLPRLLMEISKKLQICDECGNIDDMNPCHICNNHKRNKGCLCILEDIVDLWALERAHVYNGLYHVLGGNLSVHSSSTVESLRINKVIERVERYNIKEVIIATNVTVEGQTTAHYIIDELSKAVSDIKFTRLASGIPVGGELDYMDDNTITAAFQSRTDMAT